MNAVPLSPLPVSVSAGSCYVTQANLKFLIFLPQLPVNTAAPSSFSSFLPFALFPSFTYCEHTMVENTLMSGYSLGVIALPYLELCFTMTVNVHRTSHVFNIIVTAFALTDSLNCSQDAADHFQEGEKKGKEGFKCRECFLRTHC